MKRYAMWGSVKVELVEIIDSFRAIIIFNDRLVGVSPRELVVL